MADERMEDRAPPEDAWADRRCYPRSSEVVATAIVQAETGYAGAFAVENLSAGGALLIGHARLQRGDRLMVALHMQGGRPMSLSAEVVRCHARDGGDRIVAIAFKHVRPSIEDAIQGAVLSALERHRKAPDPSVLVVDDSAEAHRALERDLHALGVGMLSAMTPLEAVRHLRDREARIEVALVDLHFGPADGIDVLAFLAEHHPGIRRVLMSGRIRPCQLELALASRRAHDVLPKPWGRQRLADAVGMTTGATRASVSGARQ